MKEYFLNKEDRIYYRKNIFKNKETIVFIHGLSGSSSAWKSYENELKNKFNIITFDLRGHGKSFRPAKLNEYSINKFSNDLYKILIKEKIKKVIIISHSFGNIITFDFLMKHQNMIKALILIGADASPSERRITKILVPLLFVSRLLNYLPRFKKTGKHINYEKYIGTGDWNIRRLISDAKNSGLRSYLFSTYHAYKFNAIDFLKNINKPTLIIHGRKDTIFPLSSAIKINKEIKNSKLVILEKANHITVLNNQSELIKEIRKFINKL